MRSKASREIVARYLHIPLDCGRFTANCRSAYLSSVSSWEIAAKHSLGRLPLPTPPIDFVPAQREAHGIELLPLSEEEALYISRLPNLHRDPFDRMLICQAVVNGFAVLTPDPLISQYAVRTLW